MSVTGTAGEGRGERAARWSWREGLYLSVLPPFTWSHLVTRRHSQTLSQVWLKTIEAKNWNRYHNKVKVLLGCCHRNTSCYCHRQQSWCLQHSGFHTSKCCPNSTTNSTTVLLWIQNQLYIWGASYTNRYEETQLLCCCCCCWCWCSSAWQGAAGPIGSPGELGLTGQRVSSTPVVDLPQTPEVSLMCLCIFPLTLELRFMSTSGIISQARVATLLSARAHQSVLLFMLQTHKSSPYPRYGVLLPGRSRSLRGGRRKRTWRRQGREAGNLRVTGDRRPADIAVHSVTRCWLSSEVSRVRLHFGNGWQTVPRSAI